MAFSWEWFGLEVPGQFYSHAQNLGRANWKAGLSGALLHRHVSLTPFKRSLQPGGWTSDMVAQGSESKCSKRQEEKAKNLLRPGPRNSHSILFYSVGQSRHRVHQDWGIEHIDPTSSWENCQRIYSPLQSIPILKLLKENEGNFTEIGRQIIRQFEMTIYIYI